MFKSKLKSSLKFLAHRVVKLARAHSRAAALSVALVASLLASPHARAHEIRPTIVNAVFDAQGNFTFDLSLNIEALLAGIGPNHTDTDESPLAATYKELHALPADQLRQKFEAFAPGWLDKIVIEFEGARVRPNLAQIDIPAASDPQLARISAVRLSGKAPGNAQTFRWHYPAEFGSSILRVKQRGSDEVSATWLKDGRMSDAIPLSGVEAKTFWQTVTEYVVIGFTHIVPKGLDHILFVLGLYLLSPRLKPLLTQVTAFTLAHSITLALGLYGIVAVPPSIVEPLIALSIVYVAIENVFSSKLTLWRPFIVFAFGLLHGLGFAGILTEVGLPRADYVTGLVAFNVGVELGQLAVIAVAFAVTGLWFRSKGWYRQRIVIPASLAIACVGLFWTVERVWG